MNYIELRSLSQVMIRRSDDTQQLYRAEDEAHRAVEAAASELVKALTDLTSARLEHEDGLALELAAVLDSFGRAGMRAANLIVERYGEDDSSDQGDAAMNAASSGIPKPDPVKT